LPGQKSGCHNEVIIINEVTGRGRGGGIEETVDDIKKQLCSLKSCGSQQKKAFESFVLHLKVTVFLVNILLLINLNEM